MAIEWWKRAADQGDEEAQNALAASYYFGTGIPQDYIEAHKWANLAASGAREKDSYSSYASRKNESRPDRNSAATCARMETERETLSGPAFKFWGLCFFLENLGMASVLIHPQKQEDHIMSKRNQLALGVLDVHTSEGVGHWVARVYVGRSTSDGDRTYLTTQASSLYEFEAQIVGLKADLDTALMKAKLASAQPRPALSLE